MTWSNKGEHHKPLHADSVNGREDGVQTQGSLPIDKGRKTESVVPFVRRVGIKGSISSAKLAKDACSPFAGWLHTDANIQLPRQVKTVKTVSYAMGAPTDKALLLVSGVGKDECTWFAIGTEKRKEPSTRHG